jgi:hypothetical protein
LQAERCAIVVGECEGGGHSSWGGSERSKVIMIIWGLV